MDYITNYGIYVCVCVWCVCGVCAGVRACVRDTVCVTLCV